MAKVVVSYDGPIVSRKHAVAAGLGKYFTGKLCKNGHVCERRTIRKICLGCERMWNAKNYAKDPAFHCEQSRNQRKRNNLKKEAIAGRPKPSTCDLCGWKSRRIHFDHCHASGQFRGWLCIKCNMALGLVEDSTDLLRKMARYVEKTKICKIQ